MQKVLMVCLGNICRSPLAEGIMLKLIKENNINMRVDSAGTSNYHIDEAPDKRTIANAAKHDVDLKPLRARQFKASDFEKFDKIYVMDSDNYNEVKRISGKHWQAEKVDLLLNASYPNQNRQVPDPWYGGEEGYHEVFDLITKACAAIVQQYTKS